MRRLFDGNDTLYLFERSQPLLGMFESIFVRQRNTVSKSSCLSFWLLRCGVGIMEEHYATEGFAS